jgi:hypothetical protein
MYVLKCAAAAAAAASDFIPRRLLNRLSELISPVVDHSADG